jgi:predicted ester cyclase
VDRRALIQQYTAFWNAADVDGFRSMVVDGCIRHDPGSTVAISLDENERRLLEAHAAFPGLQLRNAWMWEHQSDTITVAYTVAFGSTVRASIEVFRFEGDRIAEVWNVAPNDGDWLP